MNNIYMFIVLAQVCSDAGKHIYDLFDKLRETSAVEQAANKKYNLKDIYIFKAINEILKGNNSSVYFYVCHDESHVANFIIYFNIRMNGKRYQVSFHSFNKKFEGFVKGSLKHKTSWDERSSREACYFIASQIGMLK